RGDVAGDGAMRDMVGGLVADRQLDPREPADAARRADRHVGRAEALAGGKSRIRHDADVDADLGEGLADEVALVDADQFGKNLVGVDDAALAVAMDDELAERCDRAATA